MPMFQGWSIPEARMLRWVLTKREVDTGTKTLVSTSQRYSGNGTNPNYFGLSNFSEDSIATKYTYPTLAPPNTSLVTS